MAVPDDWEHREVNSSCHAHAPFLEHVIVADPPCYCCRDAGLFWLQMVSLTCLLLTKDGAVGQLGAVAAAAGPPLLAVAAYLTAHSLALYVAGLWKYMK